MDLEFVILSEDRQITRYNVQGEARTGTFKCHGGGPEKPKEKKKKKIIQMNLFTK